jgi:hypothetical protein
LRRISANLGHATMMMKNHFPVDSRACPQASIVSTLTKHRTYSGYDLSYVSHTLRYVCPRTS